MIIDKENPYDALKVDVPSDAPPAYDDIHSSASTQPFASSACISSTDSSIAKLQTGLGQSSPTTNISQNVPHSRLRPRPPAVPPSRKTQTDVRETVCGLVRDVIQRCSSSRFSASDALGVLDSCAAACTAHSLSLSHILQDRYIENHSPLYWAIVSRPPASKNDEGSSSSLHGNENDEFLIALMERAAPVMSIGMSELRAACLVLSDNTLFQRLRSVPGVVPLSGTDRMLLSGSHSQTPIDSSEGAARQRVTVTEQLRGFGDIVMLREGGTSPDTEWFRAWLQLGMFQRRMRVSGELAIEFIARGRLWLLVFFVVPPSSSSAQTSTTSTESTETNNVSDVILSAARARSLRPGSWAIALALLEGSTQCYANARLIVSQSSSHSVQRAAIEPGDSRIVPDPELILTLPSHRSTPLLALPSRNPEQEDSYMHRFASRREQRSAREQFDAWKEQQERTRTIDTVLVAGIEDARPAGKCEREESTNGKGGVLMYDGCPYITPGGTLCAILEAQLSTSAPGGKYADCVIC